MLLTPAHSGVLIKASVTPEYRSFNKSQLVIVLAASDTVDVSPLGRQGACVLGRNIIYINNQD